MRVLIGCEKFGRVRDAFLDRGHVALSCDIEPCEPISPCHYQGDVLKIINGVAGRQWDMGIFFPPCTYLSSSGLHWNGRVPGRAEKTDAALEFVRQLLNAPIKRIALENPRGCINTRLANELDRLGFTRQYIQPHWFGEDASKETVLYLKNLPPLEKTQIVAGRRVEWPRGSGKFVERWANQTDSGQNRLGPSETRAEERGKTYLGVARAMAEQWG